MTARAGGADPGRFVLKGSLRAAIVTTLAFAFALEVIGDDEVALFAAFGSLALLVFVDFGGVRLARLRAFVALFAAGLVLIALGTLCSKSAWLATLAMGLAAFAIIFAGVLDDYVAAARSAAILAFVLPVMVPADAAEIPTRLAGWGLAGLLSIPAALLLWPGRPRNALGHGAAVAARALADLVDARSRGDQDAARAAARSATTATRELRRHFLGMAQRPSGTAGPTAAVARLIEDLGWLHRIADRSPDATGPSAPFVTERSEVEAATSATLRDVAVTLERGAGDPALDLGRIRHAHEAFGRAALDHFMRLEPGRDEGQATIELDDAYRLRQLAVATLQAGKDARRAFDGRAAAVLRHPRARLGASGRLLRAHANLTSVWFRNSVRGALGLALAVLVGHLADVQHAFWIVLATLSVLRSTALSTSATIAWALVGTVEGMVIGGLVVVAVGANTGLLWAALPVSVLLAAYARQAWSFAAGQAGFTIVVLVLFNLLVPAGWKVGIVRIEDVAIGTAVSLVVGVLVWPRGAMALLREAVGAAYVGSARYLDATISRLLGEAAPGECEIAGREAFETAQILDAAVRDDLASRNAPSGHLHDLTVLATGAGRVRRVARLLQDVNALLPLEPGMRESGRIEQARAEFEGQRHACSEWYTELGSSIAAAARPPDPERGPRPPQPGGPVVLEHADHDGGLAPGLAIAWAQRHVEVLTDLEPLLSNASRRIFAID